MNMKINRALLFSVQILSFILSPGGFCLADESKATSGIILDFCRIRFDGWSNSKVETNYCTQSVDFVLRNTSEVAYCILPTQGSISYLIQFEDGGHIADVRGGLSGAEHAKNITDLELQYFFIPPHENKFVRLNIQRNPVNWENTILKEGMTALRIQITLAPSMPYPGEFYRDTRLYTNRVEGVVSNVIPHKGKMENEWVLESTGGCRYADNPDVIVNWEKTK